jgi:methionine synthase II (cobalamin-independent)
MVGRLAWSEPIFVKDNMYLRSATRQTPKITLPSPSTLHL